MASFYDKLPEALKKLVRENESLARICDRPDEQFQTALDSLCDSNDVNHRYFWLGCSLYQALCLAVEAESTLATKNRMRKLQSSNFNLSISNLVCVFLGYRESYAKL